MIYKDFETYVDLDPASSFPLLNNAMLKIERINILGSLYLIGRLTKPNYINVNSIFEYWACLKYFPLFDRKYREARFIKEWDEFDSHQKTVASDELGMGFSCYYLKGLLDIVSFEDTGNVLKNLNYGLYQPKINKRGPKKTPDFIAYHTDKSLSLIECKGSQSNINALKSSMMAGKNQKNNVMGKKIKYKLVAGTFIPQYSSKEFPLIAVIDPEWAIESEFASFDNYEIACTISGLALSKDLYQMGFYNLSAAFYRSYEEHELALAFRKDNDYFQQSKVTQDLDKYKISFEQNWPYFNLTVRVTIEVERNFIEEILKYNTGKAFIRENEFVNNRMFQQEKKITETEYIFEFKSNFDIIYRFELI